MITSTQPKRFGRLQSNVKAIHKRPYRFVASCMQIESHALPTRQGFATPVQVLAINISSCGQHARANVTSVTQP